MRLDQSVERGLLGAATLVVDRRAVQPLVGMATDGLCRLFDGRLTGGTAGVGYLRKMLDVVLFPEIWRLRTNL